MTGAVEDRRTVACAVCSGAVTCLDHPIPFPYCRGCYYSGRAYAHGLAGLADMFARETGGRLSVARDDARGIQTVTVGPRSGEWCARLAVVSDDVSDPAGWSVESVGVWLVGGDRVPDWCELDRVTDWASEYTDDDGTAGSEAFSRFVLFAWPHIVAYADRVGSVEDGAGA